LRVFQVPSKCRERALAGYVVTIDTGELRRQGSHQPSRLIPLGFKDKRTEWMLRVDEGSL
jgi:hypothetical protein